MARRPKLDNAQTESAITTLKPKPELATPDVVTEVVSLTPPTPGDDDNVTATQEIEKLKLVQPLRKVYGPDQLIRLEYLRRVLINLRESLSWDSACWAAGIQPDEVLGWADQDERIMLALRRQIALTERDLVRLVKGGGQGLSRAKASLEILGRLHSAWSVKTANSNVTEGLRRALDELQVVLPVQHYETVIKTIRKHSIRSQ
jgi:hypothetical protein